ncbi:transposase [Nannocystaceae bacterium ST9]
MTQPRRVLPGPTYLVTRRCSEQRFFLRPDPAVRQIFEYVLALACASFGLKLHAFVVMSNHYHLVVTDPLGKISDFAQYLNAMVARAMNELLGRSGSFWDPEPFNGVELLDEDSIFQRLAYVHANPVAARLVSRARHWEGSTSMGMAYGTRRVIERPRVFFSESMPARATLVLTRPEIYASLDDEMLQRAVADRVREAEDVAIETPVIGMRKVFAQHWNDAPPRERQALHVRPRFASTCAHVRTLAILAYREWRNCYAEALRAFCAGERNVMFPAGTYWMSVRLGCPSLAP